MKSKKDRILASPRLTVYVQRRPGKNSDSQKDNLYNQINGKNSRTDYLDTSMNIPHSQAVYIPRKTV